MAQGFYHSLAGYLMFGVAFVGLLACGAILSRLGPDRPPERRRRRHEERWPIAARPDARLGAGRVALAGRHPESTPAKPIGDLPLVLSARWLGARPAPDHSRAGAAGPERLRQPRVHTASTRPGLRCPCSSTSATTAASGRARRTIRPLNCLPGTGWEITESGYESVPGAPGLRVKTAHHRQGAAAATGSVLVPRSRPRDHERVRRQGLSDLGRDAPQPHGRGAGAHHGARGRQPESRLGRRSPSSSQDLWPELARRLPRPRPSTSAGPIGDAAKTEPAFAHVGNQPGDGHAAVGQLS